MSTLGTATASRRRLTLRGTARDRGCAGLARVEVAIALHKGKLCRYLRPADGRLAKPAKCAKARWIATKGTRRWAITTKRLPKGLYTLRSRAVDRAAKIEKKRTKANTRMYRLR